MSATLSKTQTPTGVPAATFNRILDEGYGAGAWYGSDLRTAVGDVAAGDAFKRPAPGRHNIAEVALHHAYWATQIAAKLTGEAPAKFPVDGEDWFELNDGAALPWKKVTATLEQAQQRLSQAVLETAGGARVSPLGEVERFDLVAGIAGHAAYHAGQIQLIKKLI
jgi:hypothetical protein